MASTTKTLKSKLLDALYDFEWPHGQDRYYIPVNFLEEYITVKEVSSQLSRDCPQLSSEQNDECAKAICAKAKRLYTILLCMNIEIDKGHCILDFLEGGISDNDLPFLRSNHGTEPWAQAKGAKLELCTAHHFNTCFRHSHSGCGIKALESWQAREVRVLSRDQWQVLAPVFEPLKNGKIPNYNFDNNIIFPYVEDHQTVNDSYVKSGGYSHVWGVRMHWAHQKIYKSTNPKVTTSIVYLS